MTNTSPRRPLRGRFTAVLAAIAAVALTVVSAGPASAVAGDVRTHDPSIIVAGDCYYAYSTGLGGGPGNGSIQIRRSCGSGGKRGWTFVGTIFNSVPSWITQKLGQTPPSLWAPDINYVNGQYRLYYAASIWGQTRSAVTGLATASSPAGPWTDQGQVTDQHYPIDANVAYAGSTPYLTYGGFPGIWIQPLNGSGKPTGSATQIAYRMENSSIVYNGGYYYLLGSKGSCCAGTSSTYYTAVGRSSSITGPYTDKSGNALTSGGGSSVMDSGGGDVFSDGGGLKFAYHYYDPQNNGLEHLDIRPLSFSGGWPVFGNPIGN